MNPGLTPGTNPGRTPGTIPGTFVVVNKYCGDFEVSPGEQCDDGNVISGDGCAATCQMEFLPSCGDGELDSAEECDDGNARDGDGCTALCRFEIGGCGNGRVETALNEQCDDGNNVNGDGCSFCAFEVGDDCGDGVQQDNELCDMGDRNSMNPSMCRPNCVLPKCGDRVLDFNEECDDGNNVNGDACSATCELERAAPFVGALLPNEREPERPRDYEQAIPPDLTVPRRIPVPEQTQTGPGLVIFLASGAAAGVGIARRRMPAK